jgi:hypothetical protein
MKHLSARLLVIAVLGVMIAMVGCVYEGTEVVVTEIVCVNLDQTITTGSFSTFAVCDLFKQRLMAKLDESGYELDDVQSVHMVSATFKVMALDPKDHDWKLTGDISIGRMDDPNGSYTDGPEFLTSFNNTSLKSLKGAPTNAQLNADGVEVINNALDALRSGEDPRLVLVVDNATIMPTPSSSDPMEFKLLTCVKFQAVVDTSDDN